jgi:hypothetical protein
MLAVLAMLAPKWRLRVAPGGSAPPIPSAARRVAAVLRPGRESRAPQPNWKADLIQLVGHAIAGLLGVTVVLPL